MELRRRWLLVATVAVAAAGATAAFSFTAAKHYRATAVVVVQPTPPQDLLGLAVLHDTSRRTAAATAARLVEDAAVAQRVSDRLGLGISGASLLRKVSTHVVPRTDAVEVTVTDTSPARAAQIANGLVDGFLADRSATFGSQVHSAIAKLRTRLASLSPADRSGPQGRDLTAAMASLQRWVGFGDPTVSHGPAAVEPRSAAWPHPFWWTLYGGLVGIGAGLVAALALGFATTLRRREVVAAAQYDRPMSDRAAERLAQRLERHLAERVESLAEMEARLAARESALETREREVTAKLDELRRTAKAAPAQAAEDAAAAERLAAHERELERREQELAERGATVERRERALAARAAELQQLEAKIDERRAAQATTLEPAAPEPAPMQPAPPVPAPHAAPEPAASVEAAPANGSQSTGWRLAELERLVESHAPDRPDRAEEWRSYLFYLRDYVDADGRVPSHFDWLIEDTFGELLVHG